MKSIKSILGLIRQADQKYTFFEENDRVLVGVSGGKDSMVLAYSLLQYQKFNFVNFEIVLAILDLGFPGFDAKEMVEYFDSLGAKLHVIDSKDVYQILKVQQKEAKHLPCSICSRMKKAAINKVANELGCNKVAFAHHADDAIETLFLNEIYGGRIATFQPKMYLERAKIGFIRPLILAHENEIIKCQKEESIPSFSSHCPNDGITKRAEMKSLLKSIYKEYPSAKDNFLTMLDNYEKECLFYNDSYLKIERKDLSLKPVITANDSDIYHNISKNNNLPNNEKRFVIYKLSKPIGIVSLIFSKESIIINSPILIRKNNTTTINVISFLTQIISHKYNPINILINNYKENEDKLLKLGYEKTHISGFIKKIS